MVDFTSTRASTIEVAPHVSCEGSQVRAVVAKPLSTSPPLTTDGVDKVYYQLGEIHGIATAQLAECARWHQSDSTPSLIQPRTSWKRPTEMPCTIRLAPSPLTNFLSQTPLRQQGRHVEPQSHRQAHQGSMGMLPERRARTDIATSSATPPWK
jgi:hypothetical protein